MTELIEVNVATLSGPALDWAVAHATEAWTWAHEWFPTMTLDPTFSGVSCTASDGSVWLIPRNPMRQGLQKFAPSTDWDQGGPLIEKHVECLESFAGQTEWSACCFGSEVPVPVLYRHTGETPLIAACRAIVAAKLGDTVQVPKELI